MTIEEMNRTLGTSRANLLQPLLDASESIRRHPKESTKLFGKLQICGWDDVDEEDREFVLGLAALKIMELLVELSSDEIAAIVKGN